MLVFARKWILLTLTLAASAWAADKNLTSQANLAAFQKACEQLLHSDLSGAYVVINPKTKDSALIKLHKLGATGSYAMSTAKIDMPAEGLQEIEINRTARGWLIGDPNDSQRRVNVMSLDRDGKSLLFRFDDVAETSGFYYLARPTDDRVSLSGDALNPDSFVLRMEGGFDGIFEFTRVKLDRIFDAHVSQSLKSLLATRLENGEGPVLGDYIVTVEMKKPMDLHEAIDILGTEFVYPLDLEDTNIPHYRFAVPKSVYELLAAIPGWTRQWQIGRIDAVKGQLLDRELVKRIVDRGKAIQSSKHVKNGDFNPVALDRLSKLADELQPQKPAAAQTPAQTAQSGPAVQPPGPKVIHDDDKE